MEYPIYYHFDSNIRIYEKNGFRTSSPDYESHFVKINIIGENDKEYLCDFGRTINKRSMLYKINSTLRKKVFTEKEKDDDIYEKSKSYKIAEIVRNSKADVLREIERLLNVNF